MSWFTFLDPIKNDHWIRSKLFPKIKTADESAADFQPTTASEGESIGVIFGTVFKSDANICWYGDIKTQAIKSKGGKK